MQAGTLWACLLNIQLQGKKCQGWQQKSEMIVMVLLLLVMQEAAPQEAAPREVGVRMIHNILGFTRMLCMNDKQRKQDAKTHRRCKIGPMHLPFFASDDCHPVVASRPQAVPSQCHRVFLKTSYRKEPNPSLSVCHRTTKTRFLAYLVLPMLPLSLLVHSVREKLPPEEGKRLLSFPRDSRFCWRGDNVSFRLARIAADKRYKRLFVTTRVRYQSCNDMLSISTLALSKFTATVHGHKTLDTEPTSSIEGFCKWQNHTQVEIKTEDS